APTFVLTSAIDGTAGLADLDAEALRQLAHRVCETEAVRLLHEANRVARGVTTEAAVEAALFADVAARALFVVEGAEPHQAAPALLELDALADDRLHANAFADGLDRLLSEHPCSLAVALDSERSRRRVPSEPRQSSYFSARSVTERTAL